jgi:putative NIF3 family GTP cyclohydrolase 1 type 2
MKKTPLQKLIDRLNDYLIDARIVVDNPTDYIIEDVVEAKKQIRYTEICISESTELLEEEKQMVVEAYVTGDWEYDKIAMPKTRAEQYFNETFEK